MEYLEKNLSFTRRFLEQEIPEIKLGPVQGTYLLWLDCRAFRMDHLALMDFFLNEAKVALNDGYTFGAEGDGFMRLNIACPRSQLEEALKRMAQAAAKWRERQ